MGRPDPILVLAIVAAYFFLAFAGMFHHHSGPLPAQFSHSALCGANETYHFLGHVLKSPSKSLPGSPCVICQSLKDNGPSVAATEQCDGVLALVALVRPPVSHLQCLSLYDFGSPRAPPLS